MTFSLRMARDEDSAQLKLLDPDLLGDGLRKRQLHPTAWRSEALSLLPKILGPGPLALYYATWQGVDGDGDFAFHPAPFLDLFGMKNDTRARARLAAELRRYAAPLDSPSSRVRNANRLAWPSRSGIRSGCSLPRRWRRRRKAGIAGNDQLTLVAIGRVEARDLQAKVGAQALSVTTQAKSD